MIKLSVLIKIWDVLHLKSTGEIGFCDLCDAIEASGIVIQNDCKHL